MRIRMGEKEKEGEKNRAQWRDVYLACRRTSPSAWYSTCRCRESIPLSFLALPPAHFRQSLHIEEWQSVESPRSPQLRVSLCNVLCRGCDLDGARRGDSAALSVAGPLKIVNGLRHDDPATLGAVVAMLKTPFAVELTLHGSGIDRCVEVLGSVLGHAERRETDKGKQDTRFDWYVKRPANSTAAPLQTPKIPSFSVPESAFAVFCVFNSCILAAAPNGPPQTRSPSCGT